MGVAFVAAEGAPGFVADKGELDGLVGGERYVLKSLLTAAGEGGVHDRLEHGGRDEEALIVLGVVRCDSVARCNTLRAGWKFGRYLFQDGCTMYLLGVRQTRGVKKGKSFGVEGEKMAAEHGGAGLDGLKLEG